MSCKEREARLRLPFFFGVCSFADKMAGRIAKRFLTAFPPRKSEEKFLGRGATWRISDEPTCETGTFSPLYGT